jgi:hypothetical protein
MKILLGSKSGNRQKKAAVEGSRRTDVDGYAQCV